MKLNRKKMIAIICLSVSIIGTLAGCTDKTEEKVTSTSGAADLEPVELSWYFVGNSNPDNDAVFEKANEIIKREINATVEFNPISYGEYAQKMNLKMAANEPFDICYTNVSEWNMDYIDMSKKGAFIPLDDLLTEYAPKTKENIPEDILNAGKIDGVLYGVPNYQVSYRQSCLIFNKNIIDKANALEDFNNIKTIDDIDALFEKIKNSNQDVIINTGKPTELIKYLLPYEEYESEVITGLPISVDANLKVNDNTTGKYYERELTGLRMAREWYEKGYFPKEIAVKSDYTKEKTAGKTLWWWEVNKPGVVASEEAKYGYPVYLLPLGERILTQRSILSTVSAVSRTSKNPERAVMFIELINTNKELYNLLTFGIEGTHYKKVGNDRIELINSENYSQEAWALGCQFNAYLLPGQADNVWEETKSNNMDSKKDYLLTFCLDSDPIKTEITNIKSVRSEYSVIENGISPDYEQLLNERNEKYRSAGLDKVITEVQRQIDEWAKKNNLK